MFQKSKGWIGIDVGAQSIKVAQVEQAGESFCLRDAVILPRGEPWRWDDPTDATTSRASYKEISAALNAGHHFCGRKTACTLPPCLYQIHALRLPPGKPTERRSMAAHELAEHDQRNNTDFEFDFWDIETAEADDDSESPNVNVLSLASVWGDQVARDFARLKLNCQVLDGPVHPLARAIQMMPQHNSQLPVAVLDWGFQSVTISLVIGGKPVYTRQIHRCGYHRVLDSVMETMDFSRERAQYVLLEYGLPTSHGEDRTFHPAQQMIADAVSSNLRELIEEIQRTLAYLRSQRSHWYPHQIVLFGGGAMIKNVEVLITERTGIQTEPWQMQADGVATNVDEHFPALPLLASAIALSTLAWIQK